MGSTVPGMFPAIQAGAGIANAMAEAGVRVVSFQWGEYEPLEFEVHTRDEFDQVVSGFSMRPGRLYGDVRAPRIAALGIVNGQHIRVTAPGA